MKAFEGCGGVSVSEGWVVVGQSGVFCGWWWWWVVVCISCLRSESAGGVWGCLRVVKGYKGNGWWDGGGWWWFINSLRSEGGGGIISEDGGWWWWWMVGLACFLRPAWVAGALEQSGGPPAEGKESGVVVSVSEVGGGGILSEVSGVVSEGGGGGLLTGVVVSENWWRLRSEGGGGAVLWSELVVLVVVVVSGQIWGWWWWCIGSLRLIGGDVGGGVLLVWGVVWGCLRVSEDGGVLLSEEPKPFNASSGWLQRFKKRNKITNINIGGEEASADRVAAREFPPFLREIMEEGQYTDDQVFNMDESGLFWKKLPSKTFVVKNASKCRGRKLQKERITVLFTTNASGTCKLKLSVIHTAHKPHAYKSMDMTKLYVHWLTARKAWMFSTLSLSWFDDCFVLDVKKFCEQQNVPFKILLLLDNAPGHSPLLLDRHPNINLRNLSDTNTDSESEDDEDQQLAEQELLLKQFWRTFNVKKAVDFLVEAWDQLSVATVRHAWRHVLQGIPAVRQSQSVTVAVDLAREAAQSVTAAGFYETTNDDILEVIRDPDVTTDEMVDDDDVSEEAGGASSQEEHRLSHSNVRGAIECIEKVKLLLSDDPDANRYEIFTTQLLQTMEPYIKVYHDNINTSHQQSITKFFARNPPQPAQASDSDRGRDSDDDFEGFVREALTSVDDSDGDSPEGQ
ncbi:Jerky protein-like 24 [Homarus americanus]|uniref:Jerky protein-like 24 n=1 Tax=Homarus americanus TaxID=6706 RepID=A0A8J5KA16_HOMAM|nr:Jerky protein-like 24 [Homarus americanus]